MSPRWGLCGYGCFFVRWALPIVDVCRPVGAWALVMFIFEEVWRYIEKLISLPHDGSFHRFVHTS